MMQAISNWNILSEAILQPDAWPFGFCFCHVIVESISGRYFVILLKLCFLLTTPKKSAVGAIGEVTELVKVIA